MFLTGRARALTKSPKSH